MPARSSRGEVTEGIGPQGKAGKGAVPAGHLVPWSIRRAWALGRVSYCPEEVEKPLETRMDAGLRVWQIEKYRQKYRHFEKCLALWRRGHAMTVHGMSSLATVC